MRTAGTFKSVYDAAREHLATGVGRPTDPVERREGDVWMLESGYEPTDGDIEQRLDDFIDYWYEAMQDQDYTPSSKDVDDYVQAVTAE